MSITKSINKNTYKRIKKYVLLLVKDSPKNNFVYPHINYTEKWVVKLKDNTGFVLRVAALLHDIDRAFIKNRTKNKNMGHYKGYKLKHAIASCEIAKKILGRFNFSKKAVHKILFLIKHHEYGIKDLKHPYRKDLDILIDADSLAFFEELNNYLKAWGKKATKNKIEYTWVRLSDKGKDTVKKRFSKKIKNFGFKVPDKV